MKTLTLDFEGSLKTGIREIGVVYEDQKKTTIYKEITIHDDLECINALNNVLNYEPNLFISHNIDTEKNLIKKYLPYGSNIKKNDEMKWGPWFDTAKVYRALYPQLQKYDLTFLTESFVQKTANKLAMEYCNKAKRKHHNALYDAICTHLLFNRIQKKVNLNIFIQ